MPASEALPAPEFFTPALLTDVLAVSLTALYVLRPLYGAGSGEVVDFAVDYLNPAAQRLTGLGEQPGGTLRTHFPDAFATGAFALYRRVFDTGEAGQFAYPQPAADADYFYQVAARRSGEHLVVSCTDSNDQPRSRLEAALRTSQAREQAARAEAEEQRQRLSDVLMQLPANVALHEGPDQTFSLVNPTYRRMANQRELVGQSIRAAWPELASQGILDLLDRVYHTGEPFIAAALPMQADFTRTGQLEQVYYDVFFLALRDGQGQVTGVLNFSYDVTAQVVARQQVQTLNEELAAINEELRASNEEYLFANTALSETQRQLQQLNEELENRVRERTRQLDAAQQATERQRRQWHELFRQAPASICIFDGPEWVYEFVNPRYQAMFPGRELLGKRLVDALPEVADQPLMAILRHVYDTGEPFEASEVLVPLARTAEGPVEDIYFDLTYQARRNEAGQIDGFVTYAYDVTQQVLARQQREAQQRQLAEVFAQAPVAICVFQGPSYVLDIVNPPMSEMLGHPAAALVGQPFFEALPELADQGLHALLDQVRRTDTPYVAQEQAIHLSRHAAGEVGYFNFVYQPLRDEQTQVSTVICVATDVTDQVRARQQVQDLNQELAAINEELAATNEELHESNTRLTRTNVDLDNFIYTASHDLKTPIANIEGLLRLLDDLLPAAVRQDEVVAPVLNRMQDAIERFRRTIGHLTDVSKLQAEFAQPAEVVSLATIIEEVHQDLWPQFQEAGARLAVAVDDTQPRVFSPKNLRSLVYNLVSNALKYRHPDRPAWVAIKCVPVGDSLVLTVQDNGLGLTPPQQTRLFGLFQRLHTHVDGTGVGLYAVKKIVENAGGTITVESQEGLGTTFTLTFPA